MFLVREMHQSFRVLGLIYFNMSYSEPELLTRVRLHISVQTYMELHYPYSPSKLPDTSHGNPFCLKFLNVEGWFVQQAVEGIQIKQMVLYLTPYDLCISHDTIITLTHSLNKTSFKDQLSWHCQSFPGWLNHPSFNPTRDISSSCNRIYPIATEYYTA